jgi:hypothetical protein
LIRKKKLESYPEAHISKEGAIMPKHRIACIISLLLSTIFSFSNLSFSSSTPDVLQRDGVYVAYANGVVKDTKTGLEWKTGPDENINWDEAKSWAQDLNLDGGRWRMPTTDELETFYKKGAGTRNMTPLLKTTGWFVWSSETEGLSGAKGFDFSRGGSFRLSRGLSYDARAFAVRSPSDR